MKTSSIVAVSIAALVVLGSAGGVWWMKSSAPRKPYPRATAPPPPSPVFHPATDPAPTQEEIEREDLERNDRLVRGIERALRSSDAVERETAFTHLVPRLLQFEPARVTDLVARLEPGEARDTLRPEVARLWITRDFPAADGWLETLDASERRAAAAAAFDSLSASAPEQANELAARFGIGRDDG
jgi:hypothetical protein